MKTKKNMKLFTIDSTDLHWIDGSNDNPTDYCLHGNVSAKIGDRTLEFDECTVTATALYLLKSLKNNHFIYEDNVQMLPCCGHFIIPNDDLSAVTISGCNSGVDWSVIHDGENVRFILDDGYEVRIPLNEYKEEVFRFTDMIEAFYFSSTPKKFHDKWDENAYNAFWNEWRRRREETTELNVDVRVETLSKKLPQTEFASDHSRIYEDFVRDLRVRPIPEVYHPQEYKGEESVRLVVSQHPIYSIDEVISGSDLKEYDRVQRRYTDDWVLFFKNEKMEAKEVHISTRVNQKVFDALCVQENIESLRIKWLDCKKINDVVKLRNLKKLFLESAPAVSDISPIASLSNLEVLILGQTTKAYDYSSLSALKKLKVLGICSYQTSTDTVIRVKDLDFISEMPALEYVDVIDARTDYGEK
ncbi:MAG: hypothetical protein IKI03_08205 [Clostridia bacterium]|nr:hypothetical protein [Clostridia bacterium]